MRTIAQVVGSVWVIMVVAFGIWLGFGGVFFGVSWLNFEIGIGDIWILAIAAAPGFFIWNWGTGGTPPGDEQQ